MFVGVDFGTSNSSIAVYNGDEIRLFNIDPLCLNPKVLPSYTFITKEHSTFVGIEAIENYLELESGRPAVWEKRKAGQVEVTVAGPGKGPIIYMQDLIVEVDIAAQGRLLQSIKTALRDPKYEGTQIFDRFYSIEELISLLLTTLREKCERLIGEPVRDVVIGRPVKFSDNVDTDQRAEEKLHQAAKMAGFDQVVFELEPVGGAYLYHQNASEREKVLVFDFGGGTLDMTIMELGKAIPPQTIATHGVLLGGNDIDAVLMHTLLKYFGEGSKLDSGHPFPAHIFEMLFSWQNMVELSRPEYFRLFREAHNGSDPEGIDRLESLVRNKLGFKLFQRLEQAKVDLSANHFTQVQFFEQGINLKNKITRGRFEELIADELALVDEAINELLLKSGLRAEQINAVLRTGGSSSIPAFINLLADRFSLQRVKELNLFTTIVGGLAVKGYELARN
ncbi:MAG: Hsp70 family protein [Anaerolineales bacterium]